MKAVVFREHGGPERLEYVERDAPRPGPHEVLVRVMACALNHLDIWIRQGIPGYSVPLPHISGSDVAGIVEQAGEQVTGIAAGSRVVVSPGLSCWRCEACLSGRDNYCPSYNVLGAQVNGGYAEYVVVPAINILPMPEGLSFEAAAAFPLVSVTAWHMIATLAQVRAGETVLVMGAGSGVGSVAVQMAKVCGARVVTTVGSSDKVAKAEALGADHVINHSTEDIGMRVKDLTGGRGVDVVIEHIGPQVWTQCVAALAKGGRLVTCGATTGGDVTINLRALFSRQLVLKGSYLGSRSELVEAIRLIERGLVKPIVDRVFPLKEARTAQELMAERKVFGKFVLAVG